MLAAAALVGCASQDRSPALLDTWHDCVVTAIARVDDGRTDPLSVAYGVQPMCAGLYQAVVEEQVRQMITENAQAAQRQLVRDSELKLITSQVLGERAKKRK